MQPVRLAGGHRTDADSPTVCDGVSLELPTPEER